jgi:hydrogenase maturation protease
MTLLPDADLMVEFTSDGYLRLEAALARDLIPTDAAVAMSRDGHLVLFPLRGPESGGLIFKQRNAAGDRCVLVREVLNDQHPVGRRVAHWDAVQGALLIPLGETT